MSELELQNNVDAFRFEALEGGQLVSQIDYLVEGDVLSLTHTGTPAHLRGRGLAGKLVKYALDEIRANGQRVVPLCPYVASYITDHPEYADLVAARG